MATIYTIGHSNHPLAVFLDLLKQASITQVLDVRAVPRSRRMPWFNQKALQASLAEVGINYSGWPVLGGRREPQPSSINGGLKNPAFQGFADFMQTPQFEVALQQVIQLLNPKDKVAVLCAEGQPKDCHRSLISDALTAHGIDVLHITAKAPLAAHVLTSSAVIDESQSPIKVFYPVSQQPLF